MNVQGKVLVVSGGGSGIGRELVLHLVGKGAQVAAVDINADALAETVNLAGPSSSVISAHVVNIADQHAVEALPEAVIIAHGTVDGLINNAGIIQPFVRVNDLDYDAINRVLNVNLYGTLYMVKAFLPHLLNRPEAHIVNVASMGAFLPVPGQTIYGASKAAVKLLTEGLYAELLNTNVDVTVVFPGAIGTNIAANSGITIETVGDDARQETRVTPANIAAQQIIEGIERNAYRVLVGGDARLMDFLVRLVPRRATHFITRQMRDLLP